MDRYKYAKRILKVIEKLTILWENGPQTEERANKIIGDIYKFSHILGSCKNPHMDWRKELIQLEKELKDL